MAEQSVNNIFNEIKLQRTKAGKAPKVIVDPAPRKRQTQETLTKPLLGVRDFSKCPRCNAPTIKSTTYLKTPSENWVECTRCNTYINTYIPQDHQAAFHKDHHRFKGNFGGYGSGKTTTTRQELYKHMFLTKNGTGLIGANISAQYEQTIKRDIESDLPWAFYADVSIKNSFIELLNGYRLIYRPFDDPGKLRSLNLDFIAIIEGSEVDPQVYTVGKTRLRNIAATTVLKVDGQYQYTLTEQGVPVPIIDGDWRQGIVESNPDAGWVKFDVLLKSHQIQFNGKYGQDLDKYKVPEEDKDPATSSHVTTTACNVFLPPTYIADVSKGRPQWWINRYLLGSFTYSEGLVYPGFVDCIVPTYTVPRDWKRLHALDYGLVDNTGALWAAIDEERGKLVIYKDKEMSERNIEYISNEVKEGSADVPQGGWARPYIIDPKSGPKRDYGKKSLIDHFLDFGLFYQPGQVSIDARVFKLNTYIEQGRLEVMDNCTHLIKEGLNYKFPSNLNAEAGISDKPEDKNNHLINPLEWIVMELPSDPRDLTHGTYDVRGRDVTAHTQEQDDLVYFNHLFGKEDVRIVPGHSQQGVVVGSSNFFNNTKFKNGGYF